MEGGREKEQLRPIGNDKDTIASDQVKQRVDITQGRQFRDPKSAGIHGNVGRLSQVDGGGEKGLME